MLALLSLLTAPAQAYGCNWLAFSDGDLQMALSFAFPGEVICVDSFDVNSEIQPFVEVTIRGLSPSSTLTDGGVLSPMVRVDGADLVLESLVLDGANNGQVMEVKNGVSLSMVDVTLRNGDASRGGCLEVDDASLSMVGGAMEFCTANERGGALYVRDGDVTIEDARFANNTSYGQGGGVYLRRAGAHSIHRTSFEFNYADGGAGGGGLYIEDGDGVSLTELDFVGNYAFLVDGGGGMYVQSGPITLLDSTFTDNGTTGGGGGLYMRNGDNSTLDGLVFTRNVSEYWTGRGGGAMYVDNDDLTVTNTRMEDNLSFGEGGALHFRGDYGAFDNVDFCNNEAFDFGGAVSVGNSDLVLTYSTFIGNVAGTFGGGVSFDDGGTYSDLIVLQNLTMIDNVAGLDGDAVYSNDSTLYLERSYMGFHTSTTAVVAGSNNDIEGAENAYGGNGVDVAGGFTDLNQVTGYTDLPANPACGDVLAPGEFSALDLGYGAWIGRYEPIPVDNDGDGVTLPTDCDDDNPQVYPGAAEICDGFDNDCDGAIDDEDGDVTDQATWYADSDDDGYGDPGDSLLSCIVPGGYVDDATDCNDADERQNAGADEVCDGVDNNCNGQTDDEDPGVVDPGTWYPDGDLDGYGDGTRPATLACTRPQGTAASSTDCNDTDVNTFPGAPEQCDKVDNDCDEEVDEGVAFVDWYPDSDSDGFGDEGATPVNDCAAPADHVSVALDCDDARSDVNPAYPEIPCDGVDNDCDAATLDDEGCGDTGDTGVPADTDTDTDTDTDADTDADADADTDADADADTDADTDAVPNNENSKAQAPVDPDYGCGCTATTPSVGWSWVARRR